MAAAELVLIPTPAAGHLASAVQFANQLINRHHRVSVTVLVITLPQDPILTQYTASLASEHRLRFINLPPADPADPNAHPTDLILSTTETQKAHVRQIVSNLPRPAGFVLDMFCTTFMEVADEFGVPSYVFFTSGAAFLGLEFHLQALHDERGSSVPAELNDVVSGSSELCVPVFVNRIPVRVLPTVVLDPRWFSFFVGLARRLREAKGIVVNTFVELESHAVSSISDDKIRRTPPVYPVGPILSLEGLGSEAGSWDKVKQWLDHQPPLSVVFLCFGSRGSFDVDQLKEIACALEHSKHRFLWALRQPPHKHDTFKRPHDYPNLEEVLPKGFLDRTAETGRVIGWASQTKILAHPAVGGFVSHCGWNSILESVWYGVPIATWPIYGEQQLNAFEIAVELGLGVEIKMDYRKEDGVIVGCEEIEGGIRCVMEQDSETRKKIKVMSEMSKKALVEGGSSYTFLGRFIEDVIENIP